MLTRISKHMSSGVALLRTNVSPSRQNDLEIGQFLDIDNNLSPSEVTKITRPSGLQVNSVGGCLTATLLKV